MLFVVLCTILCLRRPAASSPGSLATTQCPGQVELDSLQKSQLVEHERLKQVLLSQQMNQLAPGKQTKVSAFAHHHFRWLYTSEKSLRICLLHADGMVSKFDSCLQSIKPSNVASKYFEPGLVEMFHRDEFNITSVLDFGSGSGDYLRQHFELGSAITVGIETQFLGEVGWYTQGWNFSSGPVQFFQKLPDFLEEFEKLECTIFQKTPSKFDLVQTLEVFEHIPRGSHCMLLNFLASRANSLLVAGIARLGQKGIGHISNRDQADFAKEWRNRGFVEDDFLTKLLQSNVGKRAPWLKKNTIVYKMVSPKSVKCEEEKDWQIFENSNRHRCYYKSGGKVSRRSCNF